MTNAQQRALTAAKCEIRTDALTRQLYATDASIYQMEPQAVAFPKNGAEAAEAVMLAAGADWAVTPRGAGTGLAGGAVGDGLVIDMARYGRQISELDIDRRSVRVGPGIVLDQLNAFLRPHGLCFGPDVATSSRATLGGMIANNSSGARAPLYRTTADHLVSLDIVLADGRTVTVGGKNGGLREEASAIAGLVNPHATEVRRRFHRDLVKRWPGYGLDRYLETGGDLTRIFSGSEGTLAVVTSGVLNLVPVPRKKGLGVVFFASVDEAMQATVEYLDLKPVAIEHVDRVLFDQTRGQLAFRAARELLKLDDEPCESFLMVEFYDDVDERLAAFAERHVGLRRYVCANQREMDLVWALRKAGLSLLVGRKGAAKPTAGLEDVCVRPAQLPEYIRRLEAVIAPLGLAASFYGHAASGLVHVRPLVDLHSAEDIAKYRKVADACSNLTSEFQGSFAGEHGVGIARTEYMEEQVGAELLGLMREIKALLDPENRLNPGKILPSGRFRIDGDLRFGAGHLIPVPFTPVLAYAKKDESFIAHLEQCNGCGDCRKDAVVMCPTFTATGEEIMCTRGRANTIRAALEGRLGNAANVLSLPELEQALGNCLSCKACQKECPSNVDMGLLKSELLHARHQAEGMSLRERVFSRVDVLGALACITPGISNFMIRNGLVRAIMESVLGVSRKRPLPPYTKHPFHRWFARRGASPKAHRGRVFLWDDCFVRYNEPNIGIAATKVLEAAGFEVVLPKGRVCCGRPAFSMGCLDTAAGFGRHNIEWFMRQAGNEPILFLEASCYSMFAQDYRELGIPDAQRVAERCVLFEAFIHDLLEREPDALAFAERPRKTAIHGHCHAKALMDVSIMGKLAARVPGNDVKMLESGCCGMAGAFGA